VSQRTWKKTRKLSSLRREAPESRYWLAESTSVQTSRMRKWSVGPSIGEATSGRGPCGAARSAPSCSDPRRTMAERDEHPERIEDDLGVDDAIVVELAEVADGRDAVLVAAVVVALEAAADVLEDLIDHVDGKGAVEAAEVVQQEREELDVAVADLPDLGERVAELAEDLRVSAVSLQAQTDQCIVPVERADGHEHVVDRQPAELVVDEVFGEELHWRVLLGRNRRSIRRAGLVVRIVDHRDRLRRQILRGPLALDDLELATQLSADQRDARIGPCGRAWRRCAGDSGRSARAGCRRW